MITHDDLVVEVANLKNNFALSLAQANELAENLNGKIQALEVVNGILTEVLFDIAPGYKKRAFEAIGQILEDPKALQNDHTRDMLSSLLVVADPSHQARLSPDGRRSWFHIVSPSK